MKKEKLKIQLPDNRLILLIFFESNCFVFIIECVVSVFQFLM